MKKRKKHSAAEIIKKLREAEIAEAQGTVVADIARKLAVRADLLPLEEEVRRHKGSRR